MWDSAVELLDAGRIRRFQIRAQGEPLRYSDVMALWQSKGAFRAYFMSLLAEAPCLAYVWETPAVKLASVEQAFECVLVDSPGLAGANPEPEAFRQYFDSAASQPCREPPKFPPVSA